jgi:hypothetical protein
MLLIASVQSDKELISNIEEENLKLITAVNGEKSVYKLDGLLTRVSVFSDVDAADDLIAKTIEEMEQICPDSNFIP